MPNSTSTDPSDTGEGVLKKIGEIRSCYKEKFGIPRQPGLVPESTATLVINPLYGAPECFRGIEAFSHLWVLFGFHATSEQGWRSTVRPPRLGGDTRFGVFATRSNFRPNPIGLSVVKIESIAFKNGYTRIEVSNHDFLDHTPIFDLKPYLTFAESIPEARAFPRPEPRLKVTFLPEIEAEIEHLARALSLSFKAQICHLIELDPRPAYRAGKTDSDRYALSLNGYEIRFRMRAIDHAEVCEIERVVPRHTV